MAKRPDVYVRVSHRAVARTVDFGHGVAVDLDVDECPVGVEVLDAGELTLDGVLRFES